MLLLLLACAQPGKPPPADDTGCVATTEVPYDGVDQDCAGADLTDVDGDGWDGGGGPDCDDADAAIHPDAAELCDEVDNNCDGTLDDVQLWHPDRDGDGHGSANVQRETCDPPDGYVLDASDCDDLDATVSPGAPEACNGWDDDCDGLVPDDEADADADGWRTCDGDCDDADPALNPDAFERCDGVDDDCDGEVDDACVTCDLAVPEDHASVQDAIDAAAGGDTICVAAGTYVECLDYGGKDLVLLGVEGAERTILDGDYGCAVVTFESSEGPDAVLRGFTLARGYSETGGGVTVIDASPTLEELVLHANGSVGVDGRGGGLYIRGGAPVLRNLLLQGNGSRGGGYDGFGWGFGGGAYLEATDAVLENLDVVDCGAGDAGGGLALVDTTATVRNVRVYSSHAEILGGGGVYVDGGAPTFTNLLLADNGVGSGFGYEPEGGGVYVTGEGAPTFTNVLLRGNYSGDRSGAIHVASGAATFVNAVVTDNSGDTAAITGAVTFRYSDIRGNTPSDFDAADPTGTDGNVSVDPALLDDAGHLSASSALIDAGEPGLVDPDGSRSDIGPFGGPGAASWDLDGDGFPAWWRPGRYDAATSPGADCDDEDATVYPGAGC